MKSSVSRMYSWENERYPLEERRYQDRGKSSWEYEDYERIDTRYRDYRTYKDCNPPGQNCRDYDRSGRHYMECDRPPAPATRTLSLAAKNGSRDSKAQIQSLHCSWSKDCERPSNGKNTVFQDLDSLVEDPKQKKKPCFVSVGDYDPLPGRGSHDPTAGSRKTESNSLPRSITLDSFVSSGTDLDSKLSEQLAQFEKSLPGAIFGEHKKISRHFSILDYSSENDIMRGSPNSLDQQEATSLERRKALRPPPPRPRFLKSAAAQAAAADSEDEPRAPAESGSSQSSFSFKPSRPAPLPPQLTPRRDAGSPKPPQQTDVYQNTCSDDRDVFAEEEELQNQSECGLMETEQDHYSLLLRLQEVERDIEIYTKTTDELRLMLDEQDDEAIKAQTLENLGFCTSNIETLTMELQQLREAKGFSCKISCLVLDRPGASSLPLLITFLRYSD
ncbi:UNVERIFIED_CONTAM: hypothetical protein FKN15_077528 [Acipenser sinensis]